MLHSKLGNCFKLKLSIIASCLEGFQIVFDCGKPQKISAVVGPENFKFRFLNCSAMNNQTLLKTAF